MRLSEAGTLLLLGTGLVILGWLLRRVIARTIGLIAGESKTAPRPESNTVK